jgi:hypothetical protein
MPRAEVVIVARQLIAELRVSEKGLITWGENCLKFSPYPQRTVR